MATRIKAETNGVAQTAEAREMIAVAIQPPRFERIELVCKGIAPLMINKFSAKALNAMEETQREGKSAKSKKNREPKDFEKCFRDACYRSVDGWYGIHAGAFRNACISACRTVGYKMTHAKLALRVEADGYDEETGTPLVRIAGPQPVPQMDISPVRNFSGVMDVRARPIWREWEVTLRIVYDADMLRQADVVNLIQRVGLQVGIGEGRPDSKQSAGIGYGLFEIQGV